MYELKSFEELKEELGDSYDRFMYDMNTKLVEQKLCALNCVDRTIEIIKQQPAKNDSFILSRLHGIKFALNGGHKDVKD